MICSDLEARGAQLLEEDDGGRLESARALLSSILGVKLIPTGKDATRLEPT